MPERPFDKVLVANRGEIAIRVFRTLRELGVASVAVYSEADRHGLHVEHADEAFCIGGPLPADSYLRGDAILDAAVRCGAQAIHPGYGFLAENAEFARACAAAGVVFVGPSPDSIERMGSKTGSRALMRDAGVAIVPGTVEALVDVAAAVEAAEGVGYPVAVKARSGGGGKGFRVAQKRADLEAAFEGASREGERYFSDAAVYLERYVPDPRHVEVQILADTHGNVIHLGERDCTIQRRHQKLVEESPAPQATDAVREQLTAIALGAAKAVDYANAGTVECLLDGLGNAYFLEMNTRVQVEHTVTELVTGIDIVAEQLWIAAGHPLRLRQQDVVHRGHAIEVRVNAENALDDFRPSSGTIGAYREPAGLGVRVDSGVAAGSVVSPYYDTMLAKLLAWGRTREEATHRLLRALSEFKVEGIDTLIPFHRALLATEQFAGAESCRELVAEPQRLLDAAPGEQGTAEGERSVALQRYLIEVDGKRFTVDLQPPAELALPIAPRVRRRGAGGVGAAGELAAPIPGNVLQVLANDGDAVTAGQVLCIIEAMKMENEIAAPVDGTVRDVAVAPGDSVQAGQMLLRVEV